MDALCFKQILVMLTSGLSSAAAAQTVPALGSVVEVAGQCSSGPVANTTCRRVHVNAPGIKAVEAQLRITEPATGIVARGTVLLGSGGPGSEFYGSYPGGQKIVEDLSAMGFLVVDRAWTGGWSRNESGWRKQSCRYATLLTWVHDHLHRGGKLVVTGNSGGAQEIGYALTTWSRGNILDVAVLTSGPPLARLDYVCVREPSAEWSQLCASIVQPGVMECRASCTIADFKGVPIANAFHCTQLSAQSSLAQHRADSVLHEDAVLNYPKTRVHFLFGALDCSHTVPQGLLHENKVTSEKYVQFVPKTPHLISSTPEGRAAILNAIEKRMPRASI
jgi:hypothetical protein